MFERNEKRQKGKLISLVLMLLLALMTLSRVAFAGDVASVSCGETQSAVVKKDGTLWVCGYNEYGGLGLGDTTDRDTFVQAMTNVASVSCGQTQTAVVKKDGTLWVCGDNYFGELGLGDTTECYTFVQAMTNVASVCGGMAHTAVVKKDGTLWVCGGNSYGQLGDGTREDRLTPEKITIVSPGTSPDVPDDSSKQITAPQTQPTAKTYTVTFNLNGKGAKFAKGAKKTKNVTNGKKYGALPKVSRKGCKFLGWFTKKKGGDKITKKTSVDLKKNQTLYAHWEITITLNANGGRFPNKKKTKKIRVICDEKYGKLPTPTRAGFKFIGWNTEKQYGAQILANGVEILPGTIVKSEENRSLYATWWRTASIKHKKKESPTATYKYGVLAKDRLSNGIDETVADIILKGKCQKKQGDYYVWNYKGETVAIEETEFHGRHIWFSNKKQKEINKKISESLSKGNQDNGTLIVVEQTGSSISIAKIKEEVLYSGGQLILKVTVLDSVTYFRGVPNNPAFHKINPDIKILPRVKVTIKHPKKPVDEPQRINYYKFDGTGKLVKKNADKTWAKAVELGFSTFDAITGAVSLNPISSAKDLWSFFKDSEDLALIHTKTSSYSSGEIAKSMNDEFIASVNNESPIYLCKKKDNISVTLGLPLGLLNSVKDGISYEVDFSLEVK